MQQSNLKESSDATGGTKEAGSVEGDKEQSPALTGSFSAQLGHSNPYVYDQFSLKTTEQWINQIVLLQVGTASNTGEVIMAMKSNKDVLTIPNAGRDLPHQNGL